MADFQVILEQAAFAGKKVAIATKERGIVTGVYHSVDEFETDPDRLGFVIVLDVHSADTVFIDEINEITVT